MPVMVRFFFQPPSIYLYCCTYLPTSFAILLFLCSLLSIQNVSSLKLQAFHFFFNICEHDLGVKYSFLVFAKSIDISIFGFQITYRTLSGCYSNTLNFYSTLVFVNGYLMRYSILIMNEYVPYNFTFMCNFYVPYVMITCVHFCLMLAFKLKFLLCFSFLNVKIICVKHWRGDHEGA